MHWINWIQFFSSFWMMVTIWFVQCVHYPLFLAVPLDHKGHYFHRHQTLISFIVMPVMLVELGSLVLMGSVLQYNYYWISLLVMLVTIWASTFFIQVPCHQRLLTDPSVEVIHRLIASNWIRTILWTIKTLTIGIFLYWGFK